jgi:hypothetical protein
MNYTVRVRCSNVGTALSYRQLSRLEAGLDKLADGAHGPVLQISKKQNRELPYASARWPSRSEVLGTQSCYKRVGVFTLLKSSLQKGRRFAAPVNCPLEKLHCPVLVIVPFHFLAANRIRVSGHEYRNCHLNYLLTNALLHLTARQYGTFVLPDAAPGSVLVL